MEGRQFRRTPKGGGSLAVKHYGPTHATFGLGAQLTCGARDKAAEAVRAVCAAPQRHDRKTGSVIENTCPSFRDDGSIRYDAN